MADTKISALTAVTTPLPTDEFVVNQSGTSKKVTLAQIETMVGIVFAATPADVPINDTADVTIVTTDIGTVAGDQLIVDAWFTILNNSTATRVYVITLDFDALFDIEISTGAMATSSTLLHPFRVTGIIDIRSSSLAYSMVTVEGQLAAGIASGTDTTMAATHLRGQGWGTSASDATGTCTVALKIRSANATATQTCRLHYLTVYKAP